MTHTFRLALRSLRRARGMTAVAVATLAIGLGSAVALMGMIDAGVRPLPVPHGDRVVELELRDGRAARVEAPVPVRDWAVGQGVVEAGAVAQSQATLVHPVAGAFRLSGAAMQPSVFRLLQVAPAVGRLPTDAADDAAALVVAWSVWQEMGADPSLMGTVVRVDGRPHPLIGVMPEGFGFPERQSFWTVLPPDATGEVVARLAPGIEPGVAMQALEARVTAAAQAQAAQHLPYAVTIEPWTRSRDNGGEGPVFVGLALLVALLLAVCAANVSTLLLVRGEERASLLAVHAALGATRVRVGAQLFTEALLIALGGALLGLAAGFTLLRWMQLSLSQHWGYYWMTMEVRLPVVAGTAVAMVLTALLAGTAPAVQAMRVDVARLLAHAGRAGRDPRRAALGRWFVGAQVALSTVGLVVAAYLAWGVGRLERVTERLPMEHVAIALITLPSDRYATPADRDLLAQRLRAALGRLHGVRTVAIGTTLPGGPGTSAPLVLPGDVPGEPGAPAARRTMWDAFDAGLGPTYGMRLVAGRAFTAEDDANAPPVALVTAATARRLFGARAVGERLRLEGVHGDGAWAEVIGVIEDWMPEREGVAADRVILPLAQAPASVLTLSVNAADPGAVLADVRSAVARIDRELPLDVLQTLQARMDWFLRMARVIAAFGLFGGLASALVAAVGLYGVIAFQVRSRTREIGVRMAVGAGRVRILALFVGESVRRVLPGLALGVAAALFIAPFVARFAAGGATPPDALLLGLVVLGMTAIGVAAAIEPAVRAMRVEPQVVLRAD